MPAREGAGGAVGAPLRSPPTSMLTTRLATSTLKRATSTLKRAALVALTAAFAGVSASPVMGSAQEQKAPSAVAVAAAVVQDEQAFALQLLRRLGPGTANLVLSPSSLAELLAMVEAGASGTTEAGIARALQSEGLSALEQARGWQALGAELEAAARAGHSTLNTANAAWLKDGLVVRDAYLRTLSQDFGASVERASLLDPSAAAATINAWVASRTGGHIAHLLSARQLVDAVAVLVDAVYFDAPWARAFAASLTAPAPFYISRAKTARVEMMSSGQGRTYAVSVSPSLEAARLGYAGGKFSALVLMPPLGQLQHFEAGLTPEELSRIVSHLQLEPAIVKLPKFSISSELSLGGALAKMGMGQAFSPSANFSNLSPEPLRLSFVVHDAQVVVSEKGTEASAATGTGIVATAVPSEKLPELVFDHPFVLLVRDNRSGAVLFEAQVGDPAQ